MWIYILIIFIVVYAFFKEREALGCPPNFLNGEDCDNYIGKAVQGTEPSEDDNVTEILDKIKYATYYDFRFVRWRGILLGSFLATLLLWFVVFQRIPREWELVCGILVLFVVFSCLHRFYLFHVTRSIERNISESVDILQKKYYDKYCNFPEGYKVFYPYHKLNLDDHDQTPFIV